MVDRRVGARDRRAEPRAAVHLEHLGTHAVGLRLSGEATNSRSFAPRHLSLWLFSPPTTWDAVYVLLKPRLPSARAACSITNESSALKTFSQMCGAPPSSTIRLVRRLLCSG